MPRKSRAGSMDIVSCLRTVSTALDDIAGANDKLVQQHQRMQALLTDMLSMARAGGSSSQMIKVQMAMQRENTYFTSISNVLKTRHDTAKNAIGNIR